MAAVASPHTTHTRTSVALGLELGTPAPTRPVTPATRFPEADMATPDKAEETTMSSPRSVDGALVDPAGSPRVSVRKLVYEYEGHERAPSGGTRSVSVLSLNGHGGALGEGKGDGSLGSYKANSRFSRSVADLSSRAADARDSVRQRTRSVIDRVERAVRPERTDSRSAPVSMLLPHSWSTSRVDLVHTPSSRPTSTGSGTGTRTPSSRATSITRRSASHGPTPTKASISSPTSRGPSTHTAPSPPISTHPRAAHPQTPTRSATLHHSLCATASSSTPHLLSSYPSSSAAESSPRQRRASLGSRALASLRRSSKQHPNNPSPPIDEAEATTTTASSVYPSADPRARVSAYDFLAHEQPPEILVPTAPLPQTPPKRRVTLPRFLQRRDRMSGNGGAATCVIPAGKVASAVASVEKVPVQEVIDKTAAKTSPKGPRPNVKSTSAKIVATDSVTVNNNTVVHATVAPPSPPKTPPQVQPVVKATPPLPTVQEDPPVAVVKASPEHPVIVALPTPEATPKISKTDMPSSIRSGRSSSDAPLGDRIGVTKHIIEEVSIPVNACAADVEKVLGAMGRDDKAGSASARDSPTPSPKKSKEPAPGTKGGLKPIAMVDYSKYKSCNRRAASCPGHMCPGQKAAHANCSPATPAHKTAPGPPVKLDVGDLEITVGPNPAAPAVAATPAPAPIPVPTPVPAVQPVAPVAAPAPAPAAPAAPAGESITIDAGGAHITVESGAKAAAPVPTPAPAPAPAPEKTTETIVISGGAVSVTTPAAKTAPGPPAVPAPAAPAAEPSSAVNIKIDVAGDKDKEKKEDKKEEKKEEKKEVKEDKKEKKKASKKDKKAKSQKSSSSSDSDSEVEVEITRKGSGDEKISIKHKHKSDDKEEEKAAEDKKKKAGEELRKMAEKAEANHKHHHHHHHHDDTAPIPGGMPAPGVMPVPGMGMWHPPMVPPVMPMGIPGMPIAGMGLGVGMGPMGPMGPMGMVRPMLPLVGTPMAPLGVGGMGPMGMMHRPMVHMPYPVGGMVLPLGARVGIGMPMQMPYVPGTMAGAMPGMVPGAMPVGLPHAQWPMGAPHMAHAPFYR